MAPVFAQRHTIQAQIRRALSAAPQGIAAKATVGVLDPHGKLKELRHGSNGWTCLPAATGDPDPLPYCVDPNGLAWIESVMTGKMPDPRKPGYSYMLQGGSAWSNVDPNARSLTAGRKDYIHIPPHIMILSQRIADESGFPSGADPDPTQPFVMFGGSPYAILILPVK